MLAFVETVSASDALWIRTGVRPPEVEGYPFGVAPPTEQERATLASRLNWVIKEWTSPRGASLFQYLESRYHKRFTAEEWASVVLGKTQPVNEMIELVCKERRYFAEWVVTGSAGAEGNQVDPCDQKSIDAWEKAVQDLIERMATASGAVRKD
jgi:hypothetical protein